ncbi:MAG: outer membrane lipoprotein LolB, partial [Gammaproteobacteria bacterium]|nr:outer membrane lipoprotein LolB [Gammaproteobacteria bacterium]
AAMAPSPPAEGPEAGVAWQAHRRALQALTAWTVSGRVAVSTPEEGWQASLRWRQRGGAYDIFIRGPFGRGSVRLARDATGARLRTSEGDVYSAPDGQALLARAVGWELPVEGLRYWVRGLPWPRRPGHYRLDADGRLRALAQAGWRVRFERYTEVDGLALPAKLHLTREGLEVRLVLDRWHPRAAAVPHRARRLALE